MTAKKIAGLYRKRWTLEQAFNELTTHLRCELNTLGYPQGGVVLVLRGGVLLQRPWPSSKARLRGVRRRGDGRKQEVSNFYLTNEIHSVYGGMMVMLPPEEWTQFQTL